MKRCLPGVMVRSQASRWRHWCHDDRAIDSRCAVERASRAAAAGGPSDGLCRCVWAVGVCCCSWAVCGAARASAACNVGGADADQRRRDASAGDARDGLRRAPGFFERQEEVSPSDQHRPQASGGLDGVGWCAQAKGFSGGRGGSAGVEGAVQRVLRRFRVLSRTSAPRR